VLGIGGTALGAEEVLIDVRLAASAAVDPGDDREAGAEPSGSFGDPVALPRVGDRLLRGDHEPVSDVGRRDRAGVREARTADHAPVAQQQIDAPEGTGVRRDAGFERVEDPRERVGDRAGLGLVEPRGDAVDVVAQIDFDARGLRIDGHRDVDRDAFGEQVAERVVAAMPGDGAGGHLADGVGHLGLGVVEPLGDELPHAVGSVAVAHALEPGLADAGRSDHGQVVAVPLVRHADAGLRHADDVGDVATVALDSHAREDQPAFGVLVARERHVGRRLGVADVSLVRLGDRREEVLAFVEDGHEHDEVGGVRVPQIRVVVQERVALGEIVVQVGQRAAEQVRPEHVHR
jgi:hypothetical protein